MTAIQTASIIRAGLDASDYQAGAKKIADANAAIAKTGEAVIKAQERVEKAQEAAAKAAERAAKGGGENAKANEAAARAAERLTKAQDALARAQQAAADGQERVTRQTTAGASAVERMQRSIDAAYRSQKQYEAAQQQINAAQERGLITAQRQAELLALAAQRYGVATTAATSHTRATEAVARAHGLSYQQTQILQSGFLNLFQTIAAGGSPMAALVTQGSQMVGAFGGINIAMLAAGAAIAVVAGAAASLGGALVTAGDAQTAMIGRLTALTGSAAAARESYEGLYRAALQTGAGVKELGDGFTRFLVAAQNVGATRDQVLSLVDTVTKFGQVSGASTQEAAAGARQLGQALASGKLQGDELRSILENMPLFGQALAKELGVSVGELRKMGEEGRLTSDVVFPAILRLSKEANEQFAMLPLTVARAAGQLSTAWTGFAARFDETIGLSRTLASILGAAAGGLDRLRSGIGGASTDEQVAALQARRQQMGGFQRDESGGIGAFLRNVVRQPLGFDPARDSPASLDAQIEALKAFGAEERRLTAFRLEQEKVTAAATAAENRRTAALAEAVKVGQSLIPAEAARVKLDEQRDVINKALETGAIDLARATELRGAAETAYREALDKSSGAKRAAAEVTREQAAALREITAPAEAAAKAMQAFLERVEEAPLSAGRKLLIDYDQAVEKVSLSLTAARAVLATMPASHKAYADAALAASMAETALVDATRRRNEVQARANALDAERLRAAYETVTTLEAEAAATEGGAASLAEYNRVKREAELRAKVYESVLRAEVEVLGDVEEAQRRANDAAGRAVSASRRLDESRRTADANQKFWQENERLADRFTDRLGDGIADAFLNGRKNGQSMWDFVAGYGRQILGSAISTLFSELLRGPATQLIGAVRGAFSGLFGGGGGAAGGAAGAAGGAAGAAGGGGLGLFDGLGLGYLFGGSGGGGGFFSGLAGRAQDFAHGIAPSFFAPSVATAQTAAVASNAATDAIFAAAGSGASPSAVAAASTQASTAAGVQGAGSVTLGQVGAGFGAAFSAYNAFQAFRQGNVAGGIGNAVGAGASLAMALGFTNPALLPLAIAAPLIGNLFGGNKVKHPAAGVDLAIKDGLFTTGATSSKHMGTEQILAYGTQVSKGINDSLTSTFGASARFKMDDNPRVLATGFDARANKYSVHGFGEVKAFEKPEEAMQELLFRAIKNVPIDGISTAMATILEKSTAKSLSELEVDVQFGKWYDGVDKLFKEKENAVGPFAQQLKALQDEFKAARERAEEFGLSITGINSALVRGEDALRGEFVDQRRRATFAATGRGYLNDAETAGASLSATLREAEALGLRGRSAALAAGGWTDPTVSDSITAEARAFAGQQSDSALSQIAERFRISSDRGEMLVGIYAELELRQRAAARSAFELSQQQAAAAAATNLLIESMRAQQQALIQQSNDLLKWIQDTRLGPLSPLSQRDKVAQAERLFTASGSTEDATRYLQTLTGSYSTASAEYSALYGQVENRIYGQAQGAAVNAAMLSYSMLQERGMRFDAETLDAARATAANNFRANDGLIAVPWGGARAMGGPVDAGKAYLVGERRAEVFVPRQSGAIVPQAETTGGGEIAALRTQMAEMVRLLASQNDMLARQHSEVRSDARTAALVGAGRPK